MKKIFAVISLAAFLGVIAAPVFATDDSRPVIVNQEKPKVKECDKKAEAKKDCTVPVPCCPHQKPGCDKEKK